jgi:hypothetical protein
MHEVIAKIKAKLQAYPDVPCSFTDRSAEAGPVGPEGFVVGLQVAAPEYVVSYDSWHEHFTDIEEALNCFAFGLIGECRLAITYAGSTPTKWTLQIQHDGQWVNESTTGLLLVPFWRKRRVVFRQNACIQRTTPENA